MNFTDHNKKTNEYKELKEKPHWQAPPAIRTTVKSPDIKPQVDTSKEKQQGFLLWMRRNGYRVVTKDILAVAENGKKPNLNVEIAVDMITLAPYYDTAVLVSGDGDLSYAVNAVTSLGSRVEVIGLQSTTSDSLIDVADYFIDFDTIKQYIQKDSQVGYTYRSSSTSQL